MPASDSSSQPNGEDEELHEALHSEPERLTHPIKDIKEKWKLVPAFLKVRGLVKQQIDSFNHFVERSMRAIVMASDNCRHTCDADPDWFVQYTDVHVGHPTEMVNYIERPLTPHGCRLRDMTYSAPITVDIEYTVGRQIRTKRGVHIGRMPIMLRSNRCVLHGASEAELIKRDECPLDPGGYFVVRGTEKVILIQEQLSKNRMLVELDGDGDVMATVTSSDTQRKTITKVKHKKGIFQLAHNAFDAKGVNIAVVLKAMGIESDQEICELVGGTESFATLLLPTLHEAAAERVVTRRDALTYLMRRSRKEKMRANEQRPGVRDPADEATEILAQLVLSHIPCEGFDFGAKVAYFAVMLRRMLSALIDPRYLEDRDYYGNKRLDLAGGQLALLFEDLFKKMNTELVTEAKKVLAKANRTQAFDAAANIRSDIITNAMETALSTGCWNIKRFRMDRKGATQVLSRLSFIGAIGMMTRIMSQFEKTRKVSGPRALQPSQWGMICPCDTPEGESCGLVKNLALMTHVTTDEDEEPLERLAHVLGVQPMAALHPQDLLKPHTNATVHLNGRILGTHCAPHWFVRQLRCARRAGLLSSFVSVFAQHDTVQIACDGGRLCRPLIVCDDGVPRLTSQLVADVKLGVTDFLGLVKRGVIEFVDTNEENDTLVAISERDCRPGVTHMEVEPFTILGVVSGLIPYPHHNQSPRNTYQCAMGKQAMGNMGYNQHLRMDTLLYLLVSPQKPLVTTHTIEMVGFEKMGAGQNATICVMSYSGYDIEDAIVVSKASLDRGFGRCIVNHSYKGQLKRYINRTSDRIVAPAAAQRTGRYKALGPDGLADVGTQIGPGDTYLYKQVPSNVRDPVGEAAAQDAFYRSQEARYKGLAGEKTMVDKVLLTGNDDNFMVVKTLVRHVRRPELGDKFSSRHGQKGVVGHIVAQEDLPFSERGIAPDLIMNPHGFPSRMTVGKMIELLGGKAGLLDGRFHKGTAFGEAAGLADNLDSICRTLLRHGYSYTGKDLLTSGITGEPLEAYIFMGPVYYQKLKHMVLDKVHARSRGPRVTLTRQPTEGRSRDGGLRLGEMERDCLVAYGASNLLLERLMISSDLFTVHVDQKSGLLGWWDSHQQRPVSPIDRSSEHMVAIKMPYACKLLFQELQSMNIVPRISLQEL